MSQPLQFAIIGLGRAGWDIHAKMLRSRPDSQITAVADPVPNRVNQAAAELHCRTATSLDEILTLPNVDVIVLATPSLHHADEAIASLRAGKHVVVEKPMAMSVAQADQMLAASQQTGKKLFINQSYRFRPEFLHLQQILSSNLLGRLFHLRHNTTSFHRRNDWQTLSKFGGGLLNNTGAHYIDFAVHLLPGRVTQVLGDLQQIASAGDVEDHVKVLLRTDQNATADIEITMAENLPNPLPKWILCGTHGTLTSDGVTSTVRYFNPAQAPPISPLEGAAPNRRYGNDDQLPWQQTTFRADQSPEIHLYDNLFDVLQNGAEMVVTPQSVRESIRVMELIRQSARK